MKKAMLLVLIVQFAVASVSAYPGGNGDRKRFFFIAGTGYASSHPEGALLEAGVEIRLFGNLHARIIVDYYFGNNTMKADIRVKHIYGVSFFAVYKMRVSETVDFRLKAGGHYAGIRAEMTVLGLTFTTSMADFGFGAGGGFSLQLSNKVYLYAEASVKHLLLDEPWTWVKGQMGVMFRIR
jgi:hypothetical protein